ncbi:hypothetical protein Ocin01_16867, partial [Orchesella cincta]
MLQKLSYFEPGTILRLDRFVIEPLPNLFQELNKTGIVWHRKRRQSEVFMEDEPQTIYTTFVNKDSLSERENDDENLYYKVECFPLSSILWAMNITSVDFLYYGLMSWISRIGNFSVITLKHQNIPLKDKPKIKMLMKMKDRYSKNLY